MIDIDIVEISKVYKPGLFKKDIIAVSGLSLEVRQGEVFGLVGPNGAGKSTTIRMILRLVRPDAGSIFFRGQPVDVSNIQREIGYLPENPYLYDHLTLQELLNFCGKSSGLLPSQIKKNSQKLMTKLALLDAQRRQLRTFSKGMLQRAGICFALLHDPSIVILDEPMSGLDPIGRRMVFDLIMDLKHQGKTIFFCSHILNDVERLCDRIGVMNKGRLIKQFERKDFFQDFGKVVFLLTSQISTTHQEELQSLGASIRNEVGGHLLAIPNDRYYAVNDYLETSKIRVLGCRSEWLSLENLFMQTVREQAQ